jgi:catechol 2,3-dioxygenase-like lactoylglutathione lyase family enzyme
VIDARFGHANVIARDWQRLAGTGIAGAALRGAHVRLPGLGGDGPTLEIYQYETGPEGITPAVNRPGFQHIAFVVPDVPAAREAVLAAGGGSKVGAVVTLTTADGRRVTWTYVTDPEANIIELQSWSDPVKG